MNNTETIEKLKKMRLQAMAQLHNQHTESHQHSRFTPDEYIALLTDHQWDARQDNKIQRLLVQAGFRQKATLPEVNHNHSRNLDKNAFNRLATLSFIDRKENIILTGASGVGKSYLSQAIGHHACMHEHRVTYTGTARLFGKLKIAKVDGTYLKEMKKLNKVQLLILDDFGLQELDNFARETLLEIIDDRYQQSSTIIASQLPVSTWYDIIGEGTIADAILDRIVNSSHRIELKGESLRETIKTVESNENN